MKFKKWLLENSQGIEIQTALFLEDMIDKAFQLLKQDAQSGHPIQLFTKYLNQVWPAEARQGTGFYLPQNLGNHFVAFKYLSGNTRAMALHDGNVFGGFKINIAKLRDGSLEDIENEIESLKSAVHHEAEHIQNPGDDIQYWPDEDENTKLKKTMTYMNNPGEIQAHAREMARAYAKSYPGQPFNPENAKKILHLPYFNQTHRNYFDVLSQPHKLQDVMSKIGQVENPYDKIVSVTHQILPQYQ